VIISEYTNQLLYVQGTSNVEVNALYRPVVDAAGTLRPSLTEPPWI
jgi:hypothetical protein